MTPKEILQMAREERLSYVGYDVDGTPFDTDEEHGEEDRPERPLLAMRNPLTPDELTKFAAKLPGPLPQEIRELLQYASGFGGFEDQSGVDFTAYGMFGLEELFPHSIALTDDGSGNFVVLDINGLTGEWGPVWDCCHDPPVVVFLCSTLGEFIEAFLDEYRLGKIQSGHESARKIAERARMDVWSASDRSFQLAATYRGCEDEELRKFAASVPQQVRLADFRQTTVGSGICFHRYSKFYRHASGRIFGLEKRQGIFTRILTALLGRNSGK